MHSLWIHEHSMDSYLRLRDLTATLSGDPHRQFHDEEQGFQRKIGEALDASGLTYHTHHDNPAFRPPPGCPGNGDCISTHTVPLEGGYQVYMHQRNGRMDPFIAHDCAGQAVHGILPPTSETFSHPLNNLSVPRTPTETLGEAMKSFAFSPGALKSMRGHRCGGLED